MNEYAELIRHLSDALQVPTEFILEAYMARAWTEAVWPVVLGVVFLCIAGTTGYAAKRHLAGSSVDDDGFLVFVGLVLTLGSFLAFTALTGHGLRALASPEAYALDQILSHIK